MSAFEFRLLGPVELRRGEHPVPLGSVRQRALLAVLLLSANEVVPTERLIDALWGPYPPLAARQSLHNHVSALRKLLGLGQAPAVLLTRDTGYLMEVEEERLDVARFRRLAERGSQSLAAGDPATATEPLGAALALWRGPALADVVGMLGTGPAATAGELEEARAVATEQRIEAELALGHHREVTSELERLVSAEPLREHLHGQLMLALYRCGRQAEALATYRDARQRLVSELGMEPSVGLQRLEQAILAQDPALDLLLPAPPAEQPPGGDQAPGGAERKLVTVLLCDVDEPAEPARERDPEDVGSVLAEYLERVRAEVEDLGGQVEHVVGGLTMAAFGVPRTGEDDTERAVRAALAIRDALSPADRGAAARLQVGTHEPGSGLALDPPGRVRVRAAVATGEALVGQAPAAGITGDLVTVCGRLLHTAPPGAVLVSAATERLTARTIGYGSASLLALGGRAEPVPVWSALAPRSGDLLELAGTAAAPLAGREAELRALQRAYQEVRARRTPRLVLVTGPAGIGKSRLVAELGRRLAADPRPVTWRQGRCPHGSGAPWRALAEVVAARLDGLPPDEKAVLADAAVLGGAGSAAAVAALGGREPGWTRACLERLVEGRPLRHAEGTAPDGEPAYGFRHVLVMEVAYGQVPRALRAERHRRAAAWLDGLPGGFTAGLRTRHRLRAAALARMTGAADPDQLAAVRRDLDEHDRPGRFDQAMAVAEAVLAEPAGEGTRDLELAARACRDRILRDRAHAAAAVQAAGGVLTGESEA